MSQFSKAYRSILRAFWDTFLEKYFLKKEKIFVEKVRNAQLLATPTQTAFFTDLLAPIIYDTIQERVTKLKKHLDEQSVDCLDFSIRHMIEALTIRYINPDDLSKEQRANLENYKQEQKDYLKIYLKPQYYLPEVFYYHHGLRFCNSAIRQYVANKIFIDCGAYVGDSAIALSKYSPKKIQCYEFTESSIRLFRRNIAKNHLTEMVELFPYALGNVTQTVNTYTGFALGCSIKDISTEQKVKTDSSFDIKRMDDCIPENESIGFIKADVEGALLDVLMGGQKTIVKNRPVLSLAVYHTPTELFESKPYLESLLEDYVYEFHHFNFSTEFQSELNLFAYPKEIIK